MATDRPYDGFLWPSGIYDIPSWIPAAPKEEDRAEVTSDTKGRNPRAEVTETIGLTLYVDKEGEIVGDEEGPWFYQERSHENTGVVDFHRWDDDGGNTNLAFVS